MRKFTQTIVKVEIFPFDLSYTRKSCWALLCPFSESESDTMMLKSNQVGHAISATKLSKTRDLSKVHTSDIRHYLTVGCRCHHVEVPQQVLWITVMHTCTLVQPSDLWIGRGKSIGFFRFFSCHSSDYIKYFQFMYLENTVQSWHHVWEICNFRLLKVWFHDGNRILNLENILKWVHIYIPYRRNRLHKHPFENAFSCSI